MCCRDHLVVFAAVAGSEAAWDTGTTAADEKTADAGGAEGGGVGDVPLEVVDVCVAAETPVVARVDEAVADDGEDVEEAEVEEGLVEGVVS